MRVQLAGIGFPMGPPARGERVVGRTAAVAARGTVKRDRRSMVVV